MYCPECSVTVAAYLSSVSLLLRMHERREAYYMVDNAPSKLSFLNGFNPSFIR